MTSPPRRGRCRPKGPAKLARLTRASSHLRLRASSCLIWGGAGNREYDGVTDKFFSDGFFHQKLYARDPLVRQVIGLRRARVAANPKIGIGDRPLSLFSVGVTVAPIPVSSVHSSASSVERTIGLVLCHQVAPVSAIFAVIPVMVVTVVSIVVPSVVVVVSFIVLISG